MIIKSKHRNELSFIAGTHKIIFINKGSNTLSDELAKLIDPEMKRVMTKLGLEIIENEKVYSEPVKIVENVKHANLADPTKLNVADTLIVIKGCEDVGILNEMIEFEKLNENRSTVLKALTKRIKQL